MNAGRITTAPTFTGLILQIVVTDKSATELCTPRNACVQNDLTGKLESTASQTRSVPAINVFAQSVSSLETNHFSTWRQSYQKDHTAISNINVQETSTSLTLANGRECALRTYAMSILCLGKLLVNTMTFAKAIIVNSQMTIRLKTTWL